MIALVQNSKALHIHESTQHCYASLIWDVYKCGCLITNLGKRRLFQLFYQSRLPSNLTELSDLHVTFIVGGCGLDSCLGC